MLHIVKEFLNRVSTIFNKNFSRH